jgi:hypothetical protein
MRVPDIRVMTFESLVSLFMRPERMQLHAGAW